MHDKAPAYKPLNYNRTPKRYRTIGRLKSNLSLSADLLSPVWPFPGQSSALQRVFGFNSPVLGNGPSPFNPLHHPALATATAGNELALSNGSANSPSANSTPNILTPQPNGATLNPLTSNVLPNLNGLNADWPITKQADIACLQAAAAAAVANFSWRPGKIGEFFFYLQNLMNVHNKSRSNF